MKIIALQECSHKYEKMPTTDHSWKKEDRFHSAASQFYEYIHIHLQSYMQTYRFMGEITCGLLPAL